MYLFIIILCLIPIPFLYIFYKKTQISINDTKRPQSSIHRQIDKERIRKPNRNVGDLQDFDLEKNKEKRKTIEKWINEKKDYLDAI